MATGGYYSGVLDVYYAEMTTEDTVSTAAVYDTPAVLGKTIEVTVTPDFKEGSVYASNIKTRSESRIIDYKVSLNVDKIEQEVLDTILGRQSSNGVHLVTNNQIAPYVAIGFALTLDDGTKEYWWMQKGKFAEPTVTGHTDDDSFQYQHPTIEATFIPVANSGLIAAIADDNASAAANWFKSVFTGVSMED